MPLTLTPRERAKLKARAHSLEPIVQLGQAGLTPEVVAEIDRALAAHELIKIRIGGDDRQARRESCREICERAGAAEVQQIGKILAIWRPREEE